jgi:hypothetical protein
MFLEPSLPPRFSFFPIWGNLPRFPDPCSNVNHEIRSWASRLISTAQTLDNFHAQNSRTRLSAWYAPSISLSHPWLQRVKMQRDQEHLPPSPHGKWMVTSKFYSALHYNPPYMGLLDSESLKIVPFSVKSQVSGQRWSPNVKIEDVTRCCLIRAVAQLGGQ